MSVDLSTILSGKTYYQWEGDGQSFADDDPVGTLVATAGSQNFVAADAARPTFKTGGAGGKPFLRFNGTANVMTAGAAATWKFLHDGTGMTAIVVYRTTAADPDNQFPLLDTTGTMSTTTGIGMWLSMDDRSSVPRLNRLSCGVGRGAAGRVVSFTTVDHCVRQQEWTLAILRHKTTATVSDFDGSIWVDGIEVAGEDNANAPSASNPSQTLYLGSHQVGTFFLAGDVSMVLLIAADLTTEERASVVNAITDAYTLSTIRTVTADGRWNGFPALARKNTKDITLAYRDGTAHVGESAISGKTTTDRGATFSAEGTLYDETAENREPRSFCITRLAAGTWIAPVYIADTSSPYFIEDGIKIATSSDLVTWNVSAYVAACAFTGTSTADGPIIELPNGNLLLPYYGKDTADTFYSCRVLRSTNGGSTWADLSEIADGEADSAVYSEPQLISLGGDNVMALVRDSTNTLVLKAFSTDGGVTWGALATAFAGIGAPRMWRHSVTDRIWCIYRNTSISTAAVAAYSDDDGVTWTAGIVTCPPIFPVGQTPNRMAYGHFAEDSQGGLFLAWSQENDGLTVADTYFRRFVAATAAVDDMAPTVTAAIPTTGDSLDLTFGEAVTGVDSADFASAGITFGTATGSGTAWSLPITSDPVLQGATPTLDYSGTATIDAAGNAMATFSDAEITNNSTVTADTTPPTIVVASSAVQASGLATRIVFSEAMAASGNAGMQLFRFDGGVSWDPIAITGYEWINTTTLELTHGQVYSAASGEEAIVVGYVPATGNITDVAGNELEGPLWPDTVEITNSSEAVATVGILSRLDRTRRIMPAFRNRSF